MTTWEQRGQIDDELVVAAVDRLLRFLDSNPGAGVDDITEVMKGLSSVFGAQTAASAYQALRTSREMWDLWDFLPEPDPWAVAPADQVVAATAWALRTKATDAPELELSRERLAGVLGRLVRQPGRLTVINATATARTRYARITGPYACDFCLMLAGRGAVYLSEREALQSSGTRGTRPAGTAFHDRCDCRAVESYSDADLPQAALELQQEWQAVAGIETHKDLSSAEQRELWRAHVRETRPTGTAFLPRNEVPATEPRPEVTDLVMAHILDGEPGDVRQGGHRSGTGRLAKTEFPAGWSDEKIREAVQATLDRPQWSEVNGPRRRLRRVVGDVAIEVRYSGPTRRRAAHVSTGFPLGGSGVVRNDRTDDGGIVQTHVRLDHRLFEE